MHFAWPPKAFEASINRPKIAREVLKIVGTINLHHFSCDYVYDMLGWRHFNFSSITILLTCSAISKMMNPSKKTMRTTLEALKLFHFELSIKDKMQCNIIVKLPIKIPFHH